MIRCAGVILAVGAMAFAGYAHSVPSSVPQDAPEVLHVNPPTGVRDADRASILAALEQVRPGGTVQFAPGTYLVGELIPIETPRITLQGHPHETTLRACEPDEYHEMELAVAGASAADEAWAAVTRCGMFMLTGGHVTIRGFTFEYTRLGLLLGCCHRGGVMRPTDGGYRIEGNTFQHLGNGIRAMLDSPVPSVIRGNRFINVFHALSAPQVSHLHFVDNDMSVPDPRSVPAMGYPSFAVAINALGSAASCEHNLVAGNRIQGHPIGIKIVTGPGGTCRYNVIRDNTIIASRVPLPATRIYDFEPLVTNESDPTFFGVPLQLLNEVDVSGQSGLLEDNLIEGNRVLGAQGLSIFVWRASRNRIADNTITGVAALDPFPGNVLGFPYPESPAANGSAIWLSPGSDENEIVGNTFTDVAAHAVVLEGDRNRVDRLSTSDAVRDLGTGNRVRVPAPPGDPAEEVRARTEAFFTAMSDDSPTFVGPLFYAADAVLVPAGGVVLEGLEAITRDFLRPNVARLRGVRPSRSRLVAGRDTVTWIGAFRARFAPGVDTVEAQLSNTWVRQPDGRWLITASTLALPTRGDGTGDGPIRSRFFHSDGLRLHALDFGGVGVPLVFMPNRDRTAYTFIEFAPRFTDDARVLAVTSRGSGQSDGEADGAPGIAALGRDVIALLDSLGLERAVVAHAWGEVLVYLAEQHPERVAGLIFLAGTPQPDLPALWSADTTGMLEMVPRLLASLDGAAPDEGVRALRERWYAARYLRADQRIEVPALVFTNESEASGVEDRWQGDVQYGRWVSSGELSVPDSATRAYFLRLASDEAAQEALQAVHRDLVAPAYRQASERFRRAFGEQLRTVPVEGRAIGYGYREAPEVIGPHMRRFLAEVAALERRRSGSSIPG
jgi:pimeloyl-ACP methyl ester carboxylesterase